MLTARSHLQGRGTFAEYVDRLRSQHGEKFSDCGLAEKFRPYWAKRIEVRFSHGVIKRGYVVGTAGWQPSLMLLLRQNSSGSSYLLSERDEIVRTL